MMNLPDYVIYLRRETRQLRIQTQVLQRANDANKEQVEKLREENRRLKQEIKKLKQDKEKLEQTIEKISKTKDRYRASLFDHGNFSHPENQGKKKKGGQEGHADTNREGRVDRSLYVKKRIFASECGACETPLSRVQSVKEKVLLDIVISPQIVRYLLQIERQWCRGCQKEVLVKHPDSLPFSEYGVNVLLLILFLRFRCLLSLEKIGAVTGLFGLPLSCSTIQNLLVQAKEYLGQRYQELVDAVRRGELMYNDETGWMVRGKSAWMWFAGTAEITVYKAAESRGKGIFEDLYGNSSAYSMHDGYASYESVTGKDKSLYCWSHMLRFSFEESHHDPPDSESRRIRDALVLLYQQKKQDPTMTEPQVRMRLEQLLTIESTQPSAQAILHRLQVQKEGLIHALFLTPDGTNNLAERELRPLATMRYTSSGSDTYTGMELTAVLASVVKTQLKKPMTQFFPDMKKHLLHGIAKSSWQHTHPVKVE